MISAKMIAPCGLNCALCSHALKSETPCPGCKTYDANKPDFCSDLCAIVNCEKLKELGGEYCDMCASYPCDDVMEKETRYSSAYPLKESPIDNLRKIREFGIDAFLTEEKNRWSCKECGGIICVHNGICSRCGKAYGDK